MYLKRSSHWNTHSRLLGSIEWKDLIDLSNILCFVFLWRFISKNKFIFWLFHSLYKVAKSLWNVWLLWISWEFSETSLMFYRTDRQNIRISPMLLQEPKLSLYLYQFLCCFFLMSFSNELNFLSSILIHDCLKGIRLFRLFLYCKWSFFH